MARITISSRFWAVRYDGARIPDGENGLDDGASCQRFAYALLAEAGRRVPPFRSSELWADERFTARSTLLESFDLLLFNASAESWGAHVAVFVGDDHAVHLSKSEKRPAVWPVSRFLALERYAVLIGAKRVRTGPACQPEFD